MENIVTIGDKSFVKYISRERIAEVVDQLAKRINEDYKDDTPTLLVTMNGAIVFAAELLQKLTIPCRVSGVKMASYHGGTHSSAKVQSLVGLSDDVTDQRVLIIEDIIDTGNTYEHLTQILKAHHPKDVQIVTLTFKPDVYDKDIPVKYVGIEIPNVFIAGHGLDYEELGRNLPDIYQLYTK